jgi:hypothetical protein
MKLSLLVLCAVLLVGGVAVVSGCQNACDKPAAGGK